MIDFPNKGAHCSCCNQFVFLPIKCSKCGMLFCEEHGNYENHKCDIWLKETIQERNLLKRSMKKKKKRKIFKRCEFDGCDKKLKGIKFKCKHCNKTFCMKHRLEMEHSCPHEKARIEALKRINPKKIKAMKLWNSLLQKKPKLYSRKFIAKKGDSHTFLNNENNPILLEKNLEYYHEERGVILGFIYPLTSKYIPSYLMVNKNMSIGKLMDTIFKHLQLDTNDIIQYSFFNLKRGERLKNSMRISELLKEGSLNQKDIIVLEKGGDSNFIDQTIVSELKKNLEIPRNSTFYKNHSNSLLVK